MRRLVLIYVFLLRFVAAQSLKSDESAVFRKCCTKTQSLVKIVTSDVLGNGSIRYECIEQEDGEHIYNVSVSPLYLDDSVKIVYGVADCDDVEATAMIDAEKRLLISEYQCYDRLVLEINKNATLRLSKTVALSCPHNETDKEPESAFKIEHVRKCCPKNQAYDREFHICRPIEVESNEHWLVKKLDNKNFVYEVETGLHCKSDEYAVELSDESFNLSVIGSTLTVMGRNGESGGQVLQGEWCMDRDYGSGGVVARVCSRDCSDYKAFCMRKCCPIGYHYRPRRCGSRPSDCVPNIDNGTMYNVSTYLEPLFSYYADLDLDMTMGIRSDLRCPNGKFVMESSHPSDWHRLTREGTLKTKTAVLNDYCIELFDYRRCPENDVQVTALGCFIQGTFKDFRIARVLNCMSAVCLALTLLVYCTLPELKNLHGKTLICHVSMMLLAYSCLARVQWGMVYDRLVCTLLGYGIYFGFVSSFAWLNVMCLDIWWTFGSVRTIHSLRKKSAELRRFIYYSLYAWCVGVALTLVMFLLDKYSVAKYLDANIGDEFCWFGAVQNTDTDWPHYILFVVPLGVITCTNLCLWVLTARHCARVKSEVHRLQAGSVGDRAKRRFRVDRAKYVLTVKLWVVMGAGWISELLSTLFDQPRWLWNIIDAINELQGVFIFLILVFKPKVYYLIKKKLGLEKQDPQKTAASSGRTSSTFLSRTISSDERAVLGTKVENGKNC